MARGIESAEEANLFFHPDESHLYDPFRLDGVGRPPKGSSRLPGTRAGSSCSAITTLTGSRPSRS